MKTIQVLVSPQGEVQIEATGFKGNACEQATADIEKALGVTGKKIKKPEYYQTAAHTQNVGGR